MKTSYFKYCPRCATKLVLRQEHSEDGKIPTCPKCDFAFYDNPVGATDSIIIKNNKVLVVVRNREPKKGTYDFPGGFMSGFESPEAAAIREVREETGLHFTPKKLIGVYTNTEYQWKGRLLPAIAISYLGTATGKIKISSEVSRPVWKPLNGKIKMGFKYQNQVLDDVRKLLRTS